MFGYKEGGRVQLGKKRVKKNHEYREQMVQVKFTLTLFGGSVGEKDF